MVSPPGLRQCAIALCLALCLAHESDFDEGEVFSDAEAPAYDEGEALGLAALAAAAYCSRDGVGAWACGNACVDGMEDARVVSDPSTLTVAFVGRFHGECVVSFRGSASEAQWMGNLASVAISVDWDRCSFQGEPCKVGLGFLQQYWSIEDKLREQLNAIGCGAPAELTLTGHSLGGALANIAAIDLALPPDGQEGVAEGVVRVPAKMYTFGQPAAGNHIFAKAVWEQMKGKPFYRVTRKDDPVVFMPDNHAAPGVWVQSGHEIYYSGNTDQGYSVCELRLGGAKGCAMGPGMTKKKTAALSTLCKIQKESCSHYKYLYPRLSFLMGPGDACDSSLQYTLV